MSEPTTEIKKLILTINGREEIISIDDAKKLHAALSELFDKGTTVYYPIYRDHYYDRWYPVWRTSLTAAPSNTDPLKLSANMDTLKLSAQ